MIKSFKSGTPYLDNYYNDPKLLFLFTLDAFIKSVEVLKEINVLCGKGAPVGAEESISEQQDILARESINQHLIALLGTMGTPDRWHSSEGFLVKLRNFCALFQQKVDGSEKEGLTIQHYVDKVCTDCSLAHETLYQEDRTAFLRTIEKADNSMQRLSKVLARQIQQFREDENIVFFVVNNWEKLDRFYGSRFTAKLANKMYPKGLREMLIFLTTRYKERGFDQLLPEIAAKVADLEATLA